MPTSGDSVAAQASDFVVAADIAGGITGWGIAVGIIPPSPDQVVVLLDAPGQPPEVKYLVDYAMIQATIRGPKDGYNVGYKKAKDVKSIFLGMDPVDLSGGDRWDGVTALGDINFLGNDQNSRPLFTINFRVIVERAPTILDVRTPL